MRDTKSVIAGNAAIINTLRLITQEPPTVIVDGVEHAQEHPINGADLLDWLDAVLDNPYVNPPYGTAARMGLIFDDDGER